MAQIVNITLKIARDIAGYIWGNMPFSMEHCHETHRKMAEQGTPLSVADNELHQAIADLMQEYCDGHGLEIEQLYKSDFNEEYFFNTMFDPKHN